MWLGEKHKEALATLKYGILDNKGFLLLTGDVGTGKTTLINALIQSLSNDIICTSVPDPGLEKLDFFNYIAAAFGMEREFSSKGAFLAYFKQFLLESNKNGKKVLLIIDEAQLLTQELLEEIRLLSNIEKSDTKLINIFFVGQNEFNEIVNRQQNRAVRQRLTLNYNIDPLTPEETAEYIRYRLKIAGSTGEIFDESATQEIFICSGGFPRRINVICDHCLLTGYVKEQKIINADTVKECAKELKIPKWVRNRDINGFTNTQPAESPEGRFENTARPPKALKPERPPSYREPSDHNKHPFNWIFGVLLFFVFLLFAWFYLSPVFFPDSLNEFRQDMFEVKQKITNKFPDAHDGLKMEAASTPVIPENSKPALNSPDETPDSSNQIKNENQTLTIQPDDLPVEKESTNDSVQISQIKKILPIQDDNLKKQDQTDADIEKPLIPPLPKEKIIVRFKYNTNDYANGGYQKLADFADILIAHPETKILITGYTDSEGYRKYNRKLSEFRANIVRSFFLGRGIKSEQIQAKGLGPMNPIESNDTAWGRMMNRRVEIEIIK